MTPAEVIDRRQRLRSVAQQFQQRAAAQGWKPNSATYGKHAVEFMLGVYVCGEATGHPLINDIQLTLMSVRGAYLIKEWAEYKEPA